MTQLGFTVDRKSLSGALAHAARVTERRNTIPILSNVLLRFERDKLEIVATDLDLELRAELPAATEGEGVLTVALAAFAEAVKKLKGESVRIVDMGDKRLSVTCATSGTSMRLPTLSAAEFPHIVPGDMLAEFAMPTAEFTSALGLAHAFVSTEESRYYLRGVYVHAVCDNPPPRTAEHEAAVERLAALKAELDEASRAIREAEGEDRTARFARVIEPTEALGEDFALQLQAAHDECDAFEAARCVPDVLRFASTDGHRLARITRALPPGAVNMPDVIVPTKACKVLDKIIGKKPDRPDVYVRVNGAKIEFGYGRFRLLAKVIDGTFPDYSRVIPTQNDHKLTVPALAFVDAIEGVTAICKEKTRAVTVAMNSDDPGAAILSASSPENGHAAQVFEGVTYAQPEGFGAAERVIGVNAGYIVQFLKAFAGNVTLEIADAGAPIAFKADDQPGTLFVLMPMRVDGSITTRAAVEALSLNPWEAFCRSARDYAKALAAIADQPKHARKLVRREIGRKVQAAVDYLADQGEPRHIARLKAKVELASAIAFEGDAAALYAATEAPERMLAMIARYRSTQIGAAGFAALATPAVEPERDPVQDPEPPLDPAEGEVPESEWVTNPNYPDAPENDPMQPACPPVDVTPAEPETVAAVTAEPVVAPAADEREVVKVETVYGQVIFVDAGDYADETKARVRRLHKDGSPFVERESKGGGWQRVLRDNIKRAILPRNRADRPVAAAKVAQPIDHDVAVRLAALERVVAGLTGQPVQAKPQRSAAHVRAIMAYLQLRATRQQIRNLCQSIDVANRQWLEATEARAAAEREAAKLPAAIECRDIALADVERLRVRCAALEKLHVDSGPLDTAAPKPAIILPVSRTSARAD